MLNRRKEGDRHGSFMCIANGGRSTVDYVSVNTRIYDRINSFHVITRTESDHFLMTFKIKCNFADAQPSASTTGNLNITVYKWSEARSDKFHENLSDKHTEETLSQISESLSGRVSLQVINNISSKIEGLFRFWCDSMKLPETSSNSCSLPPWYDEECHAVKKEKFKFLDLFTKTGEGYFFEMFRSLRNKFFKHMMRGKAEKYKNSQRSRIEDSVSNPKAFWGQIKKLSFTSLTKARIDAKTWFDYYRNLLNRTPVSVNKSFHRFVQNHIKSHDKNCLLVKQVILRDMTA